MPCRAAFGCHIYIQTGQGQNETDAKRGRGSGVSESIRLETVRAVCNSDFCSGGSFHAGCGDCRPFARPRRPARCPLSRTCAHACLCGTDFSRIDRCQQGSRHFEKSGGHGCRRRNEPFGSGCRRGRFADSYRNSREEWNGHRRGQVFQPLWSLFLLC